jgi:D-glycero-D-manno-heptose 1,7-bisphosphate phosphatase
MAINAGNRALFFDLAGTLVAVDESRQLPLGAENSVRVELLPGVAHKLRPIHDHLIFVVTNQAGIARGRLTLAEVEAALAELDRQLGDILTAWEICPHDDADGCDCRKPRPGMIIALAERFGVDLPASTMVGDQDVDAQAAHAAGIGNFIPAGLFFGRE